MIRKRRDPFKLRRLRQIVQLVFLAGFAFLLVKAVFGRVLGSYVPLLVLTLFTLILTLVLGRVWCGWVCPMGTVLTWTRFKGALERGERLSDRWWGVKYVLLLLILVAALLGLARPVLDWMGENPIASGTGIILLLGASVGLNYYADLFWCRYLCPLGGALALLSRISPMRRTVRVHCNDCSVCVDACPMGCVDPRRGFANDPGGCTVCIDCLPACTSSSNGFQFSRPFGGWR
jgi:NosR/NirI family nitrous oxide reductase transcriptional regulator